MQVGIDSYSYHRRYGEAARRGGPVELRRRGHSSRGRSSGTPERPAPTSSFSRPATSRSPRRSTPTCWPMPDRTSGSGSRGGTRGRPVDFTVSMAGARTALSWSLGGGSRPRRGWATTSSGSPPGAPPHAATSLRKSSSNGLWDRPVEPQITLRTSGSDSPSRTTATCGFATSSTSWRRWIGPRTLGVCLDNVNLIRVGDDMAEGTRALAPYAAPGPTQGSRAR